MLDMTRTGGKRYTPGETERIIHDGFIVQVPMAFEDYTYLSIDKGQHEAAKALGMTYWQTMSHIVIPQSIRRMIPPVCNEFVMILKDASIVFAISLQDITTIANNIRTSEGSNLVFIPALILYLIITALFTFIFNKIEKKFSVYE